MKTTFDIKGMTCSACSNAVAHAVKKLDIDNVNVNLMTNSMNVEYDDNKINIIDIINAVKNAGYYASLKQEGKIIKEEKKDIWQEQLQEMIFRLKISIPFSLVLMYIAMGHMINLPIPNFINPLKNPVSFAFTQFLLCIPVVVVNKNYFIKGFKSLIKKYPNMDSLIAIGSSASLIYGIFAIYRLSYGVNYDDTNLIHKYSHNLYFESAVMILTLITLGKYFETKSKSKTNDAVSSLLKLRPNIAHLIIDEKIIDKNVQDIQLGDILLVKSGESIPLDGIVIEGSANIDQSAINGESIPVEKTKNDEVIGATVNLSGNFKMKVTKIGNETVLSKIIELVRQANSTKAPIETLADKISSIFVPTVITLSIITFLVWFYFSHDIELSLNMSISVLVISCPCALGLATPVSIMVATGKGAQNKILFKNAQSLEILHNVNTIVFDKTGTLTQGHPIITDIILDENTDENEFFKYVLSLEEQSEHPLAKSIVNYSKKLIKSETVKNFKEIFGKGLKGNVLNENILIGNEKFLNENNIYISNFEKILKKINDSGKTILYVAKNSNIIGVLALSDTVKNTSKDAVKKLNDLNIKTIMLTGDNEKTAKYISQKLDISEYISNILPQDKDKIIQNIMSKGNKVAMVGDGINDSPSLARADVGIAIGAGTDVAIQSADVVLMKSDIFDVVTAFKLSKATLKNIKQNLFWAFFYNIICIPLAMGVFYPKFGISLNPMIASVAMSFSSIFVVTNALRLRNFKVDKKQEYIKKIDTYDVNIVRIKDFMGCENKQSPIQNLDNMYNFRDNEKNQKSNVKTIKIEGMSCIHCKNRVESELNKLGDLNAIVNLKEKTATINDMDNIDENLIKTTIEKAGYTFIDIK